MRRICFLILGLLSLNTAWASSQVVLNLNFGILTDINSNPVSDNSLIQIIASPDSAFSGPSTTSFLGSNSNDILVWSGSFSSLSTGVQGSMQLEVTIDLAQYPVSSDAFVIRWFPSLTTSSTTPGTTTYGEFGYPTDTSWVIGAADTSTPYSFLTSSANGPYPDSFGKADRITAVPEPSNYAIIVAIFSLGLLIKHGWQLAKSAA
jgi:hypothetical protein